MQLQLKASQDQVPVGKDEYGLLSHFGSGTKGIFLVRQGVQRELTDPVIGPRPGIVVSGICATRGHTSRR